MSHEFTPYADMPEFCVAELPGSGDTCNRHRDEHSQFLRYQDMTTAELNDEIEYLSEWLDAVKDRLSPPRVRFATGLIDHLKGIRDDRAQPALRRPSP